MPAKRIPKQKKRTLRPVQKCVLLGALSSAALVAMGQVPAGLDPMQDYFSGRMVVMGVALAAGAVAGVFAGKALMWFQRQQRRPAKVQNWRRPVAEVREIYHG